jgi:hypothetical protein
MRYFDGVRSGSLFVVGGAGASSPSSGRLPPRGSISGAKDGRSSSEAAASREAPNAWCRIQPREPADLIGEPDAYIEGAGRSRQ